MNITLSLTIDNDYMESEGLSDVKDVRNDIESLLGDEYTINSISEF